jgi:hypothetical protein
VRIWWGKKKREVRGRESTAEERGAAEKERMEADDDLATELLKIPVIQRVLAFRAAADSSMFPSSSPLYSCDEMVGERQDVILSIYQCI